MTVQTAARRAIGASLLAGVLAAVSHPAPASSWPDRGVRIIAPAAGSPADIAARLIGEVLSKRWKQPVVVDNRPGADNIIAIRGLLEAGDGHTLLFVTHSAVTVNGLLHAKLPYDPVHDLAPISLVVDDFLGIVVAPTLAPNSLADLVKLAASKAASSTFTPSLDRPLLRGSCSRNRAASQRRLYPIARRQQPLPICRRAASRPHWCRWRSCADRLPQRKSSCWP